jgi:hypothetical protein
MSTAAPNATINDAPIATCTAFVLMRKLHHISHCTALGTNFYHVDAQQRRRPSQMFCRRYYSSRFLYTELRCRGCLLFLLIRGEQIERKKKRSTLCAGVAAANSDEAHADKLIFYALLLAIIKDLRGLIHCALSDNCWRRSYTLH